MSLGDNPRKFRRAEACDLVSVDHIPRARHAGSTRVSGTRSRRLVCCRYGVQT